MNAAAKAISHSDFFSGRWRDLTVSKSVFLQLVLLLCCVLSALCVVYTTNVYRYTCSELEMAEQKADVLQREWGQLLLEHASLATAERIQQLATNQLNMVAPAHKQVLVLHVQ